MLSRCFYHSQTSSIITDRNLLNSETLGGLLKLLPENERYGLKYVTVCLEDGVAGDVDRDSLVAALEVFGQIRESGVSPREMFRELREREIKIAPVVKARRLTAAAKVRDPVAARRKAGKRPAGKNRRDRGGRKNGIR